MPNWIGNKLYIVGPAQDIAAFKTKNRDAYVPVQAKGARLKTTKAALSLDSHCGLSHFLRRFEIV